MQRKDSRYVTASSLKEEFATFARETLKHELEQLKADIVAEVAASKTSVIRETTEPLLHELKELKASLTEEVAESKAAIIGKLGVTSPEETSDTLKHEFEQLRLCVVMQMAENRASIVKDLKGPRRGWSTAGFGRTVSGASQASKVSSRSFPKKESAISEEREMVDIVFERHVTLERVGDQAPLLLDASAAEADPERLDQQESSSQISCFGRLSNFVRSDVFDSISAGLVMLSVAWLTFQIQDNAVKWRDDSPKEFIWVELLFCALFGAELVLRVFVSGCRAFFCDFQGTASWNWFDFGLILLQISDTVVQLTGMQDKKTKLASLVRILRLFRIFRLARIFRFFPDLRLLVVSATQAILPLMWVFALILFITGIFALFITSIVNDFKTQFTTEEFEEAEKAFADDLTMLTIHRNLDEFFGSVDRSILALYGAISGGRDWYTSALPLITFIHPQLIHVFVFYTFFVIFAMMNIITSQFVDTALEASAKDRRESMANNLMDTFAKDSGLISEDDFMEHLQDGTMKSFLKDLYRREDVTEEEIRTSRLFEMLDDDGSGAITKDELVLGCIKLTGAATSLDLAVLKLDVGEIRKDLQSLLIATTG